MQNLVDRVHIQLLYGRFLLLPGLVTQICTGHHLLESGAQRRIGVELLALGGDELRRAIVVLQVLLLGMQRRHHWRSIHIDGRFLVLH